MGTLDSYLNGEYESDKTQCRILDALIKDILFVFKTFWNGTKKSWPYRVLPEGPEAVKDFSDSTHSMILFVLEGIFRSDKISTPLFPPFCKKVRLSDGEQKDFEDLRSEATSALCDKVNQAITNGAKPLVNSSTFGKDDPLTITWLTELCVHRAGPLGSIRDSVIIAGNRVLDRMKGDSLLEWESVGENEIISDSFLKLRGIHLAKAHQVLSGGALKYCTKKDDFEKAIHRQIAYSIIPDSRFDPAELTFAFEGLLQLDARLLSESMLDRILSILEESQKRDAYWRPVTPLFGTRRGMVLFPVSVEVVNSLIRATALLKVRDPKVVSRIEPLVRRYCQWLHARLERLEYDGKSFVGWHSEHINRTGEIHLWETSQVLLFLLQYRSMLQEKIAIEGLRAAGLRPRSSEDIDPLNEFWKDEAIAGLLPESPYSVLAAIDRQFIKPVGTKQASRSILLYGPPGTGKTTVAEQLAKTLGWPLLTITVSDFLAGGAAEVEARAKGIFQILCEQKDLVILFDEIDQFLLDRNGKEYQNQTGIFQFMTPGMLTKLSALWEEKNCVFIVATNYGERIDSAIKRPGRFDDRRLLTLPGKVLRTEFLKRFIGEKELGLSGAEVEDAATKLADKTRFFGFGDIKRLVKNTNIPKPPGKDGIANALMLDLGNVEPSVKLSSYLKRFTGEEGQGPFEEFFLLLHQLAELDAKPQPAELPSINFVLTATKGSFEGVFDKSIRDKLDEWKEKHFPSVKMLRETGWDVTKA